MLPPTSLRALSSAEFIRCDRCLPASGCRWYVAGTLLRIGRLFRWKKHDRNQECTAKPLSFILTRTEVAILLMCVNSARAKSGATDPSANAYSVGGGINRILQDEYRTSNRRACDTDGRRSSVLVGALCPGSSKWDSPLWMF